MPNATIRMPTGVALDLHLHTRTSDGLWTPETLVERAVALGLGAIAVADHDAIDSVAPVTELAARRGIATIPGVEMTTRWDGRQWHLLVYGADPGLGPFGALVDQQRRLHIEAAEAAITALRRSEYAVPSLAATIGGRPPLPIYVMDAIIRDGLAPTILAANRFVTEELGVPFYIDAPLPEVVGSAHASGGLAVLAHPGRSDPEPLAPERLARMLDAARLDGLEVYYPTHTPEQVSLFGQLADQHGLLRSCGSDSHGPGRPRDPIPYPAAAVAPLLERLGVRLTIDE